MACAWMRSVPVVCLSLAACSPAAPATPDAVSDLAMLPDLAAVRIVDAAAPAPDAAGDCADSLGDKARGGVCVRSVKGQLVVETGMPLADAMVTACANACFFGTSNAQGQFTVAIDNYIRLDQFSLLTHVNPRRAAFYLALPAPVDGVVTFPKPLVARPMPPGGPEIRMDMSAQTLHGDGVDLFIDAGTTIFLSFDDTAEMPLGAELRPLTLTRFDDVPFLGGVVPLVLYGFGPFEADFNKPVRLSFANATGLAAGTAVDVLAQHGLLHGGPPAARFDVVAAAHVSQDGTRVDLDPGAGISTLTWIALRKKE